MVNIAKQSTHLPKEYNLDPEGRRGTWDKVYMGYVKGYEDQQHMGRVKLLIPELCGIVSAVGSSDGDNDSNLIIVNYAPPFAGSSPIRDVAAGGTQTSYGMWFRPGIDDAVLCMFVNGDPNRGFWFACLPHVRHSGNPSTPSSGGGVSAGEPSPFAGGAGGGVSRPVAAGTTVPAIVTGAPPDPRLTASQTVAGTAGVPVIAPSTYGSHNSWDVNGISTPGGNRVVMSDQEGDTQIRLQTRNNLQLLLHNESGMIVLMNGTGNARIEIDSDGNVDIFGKGKISMRSEGDLNLHSDADVNINAGAQLNIRSGGDTKLTSNQSMHLLSEQNLFQTSKGDTHRSSNGSMFDTSAQKIHRQSNFGIYDGVNGGDINQRAWGNIRLTASEQISSVSVGDFRIESTEGSFQLLVDQQTNLTSLQGVNIRSSDANVNISSKTDANIKSGAAINIEALADLNLLAINDAVTMQSQNNNVNLHGGPLVVIGPTTSINAGAVPSAGSADDTEVAESSPSAGYPNIALAATPVTVREHVVQDTSSRRGGTTAQRIVTSTSTRSPSAEPSPSRFSTSAGYSGTLTVERDASVTAGFPRGAIEPRTDVPLQVMGFVGAGAVFSTAASNPRIQNAASQGTARSNLPALPSAWLPIINQSAQANGLPPQMLERLIAIESGGNPNAFNSRSGARGPAQILPSTAANPGYGVPPLPADALTDPSRSIPWAASYLAALRRSYDGDLGSALAAYNWGPGNVNRFLQGGGDMPQETRNYLATLLPLVPTPAAVGAGEAAPAGTEPQRFNGVRYESDGGPVYVPEPVPNWIFKSASELSISRVGVQDIKNFEGMRGPNSGDVEGRAFDNVCGGKRMIGYGHVLTEAEISSGDITVGEATVKWADGITEAQAAELFEKDILPAESAVKSVVSSVITQQQFDSLVDLAFNIGVDKFNESEVVRAINSRQYDQVPTEMMAWCVACGLKRAELESRRRFNAMRFSGLMRAESPVRTTRSAAAGGSGGSAGGNCPPGSQPTSPNVATNYPGLNFSGIMNRPGNRDEFAKLSPAILAKGQELAARFGGQLRVTSGYRSQEYNNTLRGAAPNSYHLCGLALDITTNNFAADKSRLTGLARQLNLHVIDVYSTFIHIDTRNLPGLSRVPAASNVQASNPQARPDL